MKNDTSGPAFPLSLNKTWYAGMTLRDYFAAAALQGMLAYYHGYGSCYAAGSAYQYADAMLAERNRVAQKET